MRRGIGAAAVIKRRERDARMGELGDQIREDRATKARELLGNFKEKLSEFAIKYRSQIQRDPVLREQFVDMCESVGVDPFQSSKSIWTDIFDGLGTYYTDLAIQILSISLMNREKYGSLLPMSACVSAIQGDNVSVKDLIRAIKSLEVFGSGAVRTIKIGKELFISSMPDSSSGDAPRLMGVFDEIDGLTAVDIMSKLGWSEERVIHVVQILVKEGILWVDNYEGIRKYWIFSQWFH